MLKYRWRELAVMAAALVAIAGVVDGSASAQTHGIGRAKAHAADPPEVDLHETALLRLSRNTESVHEAKGQATGTLGGSVYLRIDVETASRMSAFYIGHSGASTLTGKGTVKYTVSGSSLHFSGSSSIVSGTGEYKNAFGNGIHLEGTMNRLTEHITMRVNGSFYK
jgi:hypothetical protein